MTTILITRPVAVAAPLVESLHRRGYVTVLEPLLTIVPVSLQRPQIKNLSGVIITSRNALAALTLRREECQDLLGLPCYCVGPRTAETARAFGFTNTESSLGDGAALAVLIKEKAKPKSSLLHIAGDDIAPAMKELLLAEGFRLKTWKVYKAQPSQTFSLVVHQQLANNHIQAVLFFSPRTAAQFVKLILQNKLQACCQSLTAIGLSKTVTDALKPLTWRRMAVASATTEEAVVACLQRYCPPS